MRFLASALLLFALLHLAQAITLSDPQLVKSMDIEVTESGNISATSGEMTNLSMNTTIPQASAYQTINYSGRTAVDADGNILASISEAAPPNPYNYEIRSTGTVRERVTGELPRSYIVPPEYARYTLPGPKVQSDDPEIRSVAQEVTANSTDDWERVAKLAVFVNNYVQYDESYTGQEKDA